MLSFPKNSVEQNPILVVDDDADDREMIKEAGLTLDNMPPILFFKSGNELVDYLENAAQSPFFILCDVNLPGETGFDIKKRISENKDLNYKSVPFIFWSTDASEKQIQSSYDLPVQGFFFKPNSFVELCNTFKIIIDYWRKSKHPKRMQ